MVIEGFVAIVATIRARDSDQGGQNNEHMNVIMMTAIFNSMYHQATIKKTKGRTIPASLPSLVLHRAESGIQKESGGTECTYCDIVARVFLPPFDSQ